MKDSTKVALIVGGVAVAGLLAYLAYRKGGQILSTSLNPVSDQNLAYTGTNSVLQSLGIVDQGSSLGSQVYDWFHAPYDPNAPAGTPVESSAVGSWLDLIWSGPQRIVSGVTDTIGGWFGDSSTSAYDYGTGTLGIPLKPSAGNTPPIIAMPDYSSSSWWAGNPSK